MDTIAPLWLWIFFVCAVLAALFIDFVALNKRGAHSVTIKEAINWSIVWVALSFAFNGLFWWAVYQEHGSALANTKSMEFLTGYLIEKSLAVDNIFVFLMIFTYFAVPPQFQKRVLMIGIVGAIVLRTVMILLGAWLIAQFHWILYLFGLFLLVTGVKMLMMAEAESDLEKNPLMRWMRGHIPITNEYHGENFSVIKDGKRWFTPLFVVMVMIGITDVIFAVDSIPAIFAVTLDPFIVLTSNVFAILGLRAMYFMLADLADRFHLLKYGLAFILIFIGIKMLLLDIYKIPIGFALSVVGIVLLVSILASLWVTRPGQKRIGH